MLKGIQETKLIVAIPSSRLSESMRLMIQEISKAAIEIIWLKHEKTDIERQFALLETDDEYPKLKIINCKTPDRHAEGFYLEGVLSSGHAGWVLRLDDDELISQKLLQEIIKKLESLNPRIAYSLPRIWIKKRDSIWQHSLMAKPSHGDYDKQIRLFHTHNVTADIKLHTPGFKFKRSKDLKFGLNIIHLIWEIENLDSRINKIKNYESILPGAGVGKLRYYLPEVFPDERHGWQSLENQCEIDTLVSWENMMGPKRQET